MPPSGSVEYWSEATMFAPASARKLATAATIPCRSGQETRSRATSVGGPFMPGIVPGTAKRRRADGPIRLRVTHEPRKRFPVTAPRERRRMRSARVMASAIAVLGVLAAGPPATGAQRYVEDGFVRAGQPRRLRGRMPPVLAPLPQDLAGGVPHALQVR